MLEAGIRPKQPFSAWETKLQKMNSSACAAFRTDMEEWRLQGAAIAADETLNTFNKCVSIEIVVGVRLADRFE